MAEFTNIVTLVTGTILGENRAHTVRGRGVDATRRRRRRRGRRACAGGAIGVWGAGGGRDAGGGGQGGGGGGWGGGGAGGSGPGGEPTPWVSGGFRGPPIPTLAITSWATRCSRRDSRPRSR